VDGTGSGPYPTAGDTGFGYLSTVTQLKQTYCLK